jgi:hypothetical protein
MALRFVCNFVHFVYFDLNILSGNGDSLVGIVSNIWAERSRNCLFIRSKLKGILLFFNASTPILDPNHPPVQWLSKILSPAAKRQPALC